MHLLFSCDILNREISGLWEIIQGGSNLRSLREPYLTSAQTYGKDYDFSSPVFGKIEFRATGI